MTLTLLIVLALSAAVILTGTALLLRHTPSRRMRRLNERLNRMKY